MKPLSGLRVVVTRALHQAEILAEPLRNAGATVLLCPTIAIAPPDHPADLQRAAASADEYDWIIFSSANAVTAFQAELSVEPHQVLHPKVAAIGEATRRHAEAAGFHVELVPDRYVAESLLDAFRHLPLSGKRVLIPRAAVARDIVPIELRKIGASVTVVEAYRNVEAPQLRERAKEVFATPLPDWVAFASSSAVEHLIPITGTSLFKNIGIASIGPVTTATLRRHGLDSRVEAPEHSIEGLVDKLCAFVTRH